MRLYISNILTKTINVFIGELIDVGAENEDAPALRSRFGITASVLPGVLPQQKLLQASGRTHWFSTS
jgi:hypothetical protein